MKMSMFAIIVVVLSTLALASGKLVQHEGKDCRNLYTKVGKCNGFSKKEVTTLDACIQKCEENASPRDDCPAPAGGCRYAVWNPNGWCNLAGEDCDMREGGKKIVVDIKGVDESDDGIGCWEQVDRDAYGPGYKGHQDTTVSGFKCQNWDTQSPHEHGYIPSKYHDKGIGDHNYCRNPAAKYTKVWCYTENPGKRWDWCDVPTCVDEGISCWDPHDRDREGSGYQGQQSTTRHGYTCQKWSSQTPNSHGYTPEKYAAKGVGDHNYCRNPAEKYKDVWCYTDSSSKRWDWCDVPTC